MIDEALLVGRNTVLLMDLHLDIVNSIRAVNRKSDGCPKLCLHEDPHQAWNWVENKEKGGLLANVVVRQGALILELFVVKDEALPTLGKSLPRFNLGL